MKLTWKMVPDAIFGYRYDLQGLTGRNDVASCHYRQSTKQFIANAFIGGRFLSHRAGTLRAALTRLQNEIDRQSIGLLGVDIVEFE